MHPSTFITFAVMTGVYVQLKPPRPCATHPLSYLNADLTPYLVPWPNSTARPSASSTDDLAARVTALRMA